MFKLCEGFSESISEVELCCENLVARSCKQSEMYHERQECKTQTDELRAEKEHERSVVSVVKNHLKELKK